MTFVKTASPDKSPHFTPECWWCNEFLSVSNLDLTVKVSDGYQYIDFDQV